MRLQLAAYSLLASMLVAAPALADLGPPPKCSKGEHHEYLMGHRCVPDGSHLEADPNGGVKVVPDKALNASPPTPTATPTASAGTPPAPSADPPAPPAPPPANRGCACSVGEGGESVLGIAAALATAIVVALRRRRSAR